MRQIAVSSICARRPSPVSSPGRKDETRESFPPLRSFPLSGSSRSGTASTLPCRQPRSIGPSQGLRVHGQYTGVSAGSPRVYRKKRRKAYHELEFLPGEGAQVDWMEATLPFGKVYGFVFILACSRYLFVTFYPRSSMEFFLDGHIRAYEEIKGAARSNWYDNLKSVVIKRKPELTLNAQFLDFARHVGFSIHACNPGKANEKGRVERVIRDLRSFVETHDFTDLADLNRKTDLWRKERNERIHRATDKAPASALAEEPLLALAGHSV